MIGLKVHYSGSLIDNVLSFLKNKKNKIIFGNLKPGTLGEYRPDEQLIILSVKLPMEQVPGVLIHECLHGLLPDLDNEDKIRQLELEASKKLTVQQVNKLFSELFKHGRWEYTGRIERNIAKAYLD